jgi:hypothetical protein
MTEAEAAAWWGARGLKVVLHRGRFWKRTQPGFYEPVHWMARLSADEASAPSRLHWGFRATLDPAHGSSANASFALHLLSDVEGYTLDRFRSNRRYQIRKAQRGARYHVLNEVRLLHEQGYAVYRSSRQRIGSSVLSEADYHRRLDDLLLGPGLRHTVVVGLVHGRLAAYLAAYAVAGTAYLESIHLATEFMNTGVGNGLIYEFVQSCRASGVIRQVVYGPHVPGAEALTVFKVSMGFPICRIPSRIWLAPFMRAVVRWRDEHAYYMITGEQNTARSSAA